MYGALFYKEWIKIRWVLLIALGISLWTLIQLYLSVREYFEFLDPVKVWIDVIHRKAIIYSGLKYNVLIAGVGIALIQFVPETLRRRLRLLFHLPVSHNRSLYFMMAVGLSFTFAVILLNIVGLAAIMSARFPTEVVASSLRTAAPWFAAGIVAYLGAVLVVVEPSWWRRAFYAALAFAVILLYYNGRGYETYAFCFWKYALLGAGFLFTVLLPAFRFKRGIY